MRPHAAAQPSEEGCQDGRHLLIHGAWHGPWSWGDFAKRRAPREHDVRAVELRGRDRPPGQIWYRIRDYVEDVGHAAVEFSSPPVFIHHSIGGLVPQKYLERRRAAGHLLMASLAPGGTIGAVARLAVHHPMPFLKTSLPLLLGPFIATRSLARDLFFSAGTPEGVVDRCFVQSQHEPYLAFIDIILVLPGPHLLKIPVLVLGAEREAIFTVRELQATARAYQEEPIIFPGMGRDMMLDSAWQKLVDCDAWVRDASARTRAK